MSVLAVNDGQLGWLPKNPRQWKPADVDRTSRSIVEDMDFFEDRPILAVPLGNSLIVFAGNLRCTAAQGLALSEVPVVVYHPETEDDKATIKRRAMKDNGSFGAWDYDALANEWDDLPLVDFGVPAWEDDDEMPDEFDASPEEKFVTKISFPDEASQSRFLAAYKDVLESDFGCRIE